MRLADLQNKTVAIWGAGRDGESALRCLRARFPQKPLTVLSDQPIAESRRCELAHLTPLRFESGDAIATALCHHEVVIKSPGISIYNNSILAAQRQGTVFTSTANLFFAEIKDSQIIAVTGTKGKSTTASIIQHCLLKMGVASEICGNIGKPFLDFLERAAQTKVWVVEFSSYQAADLIPFSKIAVLVNLFPEHTDWHGSLENYFRDKLHMFTPLTDKATILNFRDERTRHFTAGWPNVSYFESPDTIHVRGDEIFRSDKSLGPVQAKNLQGRHNLANLCAALTALEAAGFDAQRCLKTLVDFQGLPHRQMLVGTRNGLTFIDDSISTTPESTLAAIERYHDASLTLLLGGHDRKQDYHQLADNICSRNIPLVITLPNNGDRIAAAINAAKEKYQTGPDVVAATDFSSAVSEAIRMTPSGGMVLLSPAAPSYGTFENYVERGKTFQRLVGFPLK